MSDVNLPPYFSDDFARDAQGIERKTPHNDRAATLGENLSTGTTARLHYVVCEKFSELQLLQPQPQSKGLKEHSVAAISDEKKISKLAGKKKVLTELKTEPEKKSHDENEVYRAAKEIKQEIFNDEMQKARSTMRRHMTTGEYNMTVEKIGERLFQDSRFKKIIENHRWTAYKVMSELSGQKLTISKYTETH